MEIKINTKFDIGQKVYICNPAYIFENGKFKQILQPSKESILIINIIANYNSNNTDIFYIVNGGLTYSQDHVFQTFEGAQKYCNNYEF